MARETKVGLALILVLLCAFGFVVYKKLHSENALLADTGENEPTTAGDSTGSNDAPDTRPERRGGEFAYEDPPAPRRAEISAGQTEPPLAEEPQADEFSPARPRSSQPVTRDRRADSSGENPFGPSESADTKPDEFVQADAPPAEATGPAVEPLFGSQLDAPNASAVEQAAPSGASMMGDAAEPEHGPAARTSTEDASQDRPFGSASADNSPQQPSPERLGELETLTEAGESAPVARTPDDRPEGSLQPTAPAAQELFSTGGPGQSSDRRQGDYLAEPVGTAQAESTTVVRRPETEPANRADIVQTGTRGGDSLFGGSQQQPYDDPAQAPFRPTGQPAAPQAQPSRAFAADPGLLPDGDRPAVHVVGPGENYWTISKKRYGTARYFTALARYNSRRIPDPRKMRPGMKVLIPSKESLESRFPDLFPGTSSGAAPGAAALPSGFFRDAQGRPMYRVGRRDTLTEVADEHLGRSSRWIQIYEMNRDRIRNPADLKIGTELRLPPDASTARLVRSPRDVRQQ